LSVTINQIESIPICTLVVAHCNHTHNVFSIFFFSVITLKGFINFVSP